MKKGMIFLTVVVMLTMVGVSWAEQGDVDVDVTWVSKYLWRGFDILDDKAAFQPSVNVDLGSGFSLNVFTSMPGGSAGKDKYGVSRLNYEEWRYTLTYAGTAFEGEAYKANYGINWTYYDFPQAPGNDEGDMQEFVVGFSLPDICEAGIVPSYAIVRMWPAKGGGANRAMGGYIHVFGLGYQYTCPDLPELPLNLSCSATYNDGTPGGAGIDSDWSHIVWGISTTIDCPSGGKITPALYYQTSMDDSVNDEDELWCGVTYGFSF